MNITIKVSGLIEKSLGYKERVLAIEDGSSVGQMIEKIHIKINPSWMMIMVNGKRVTVRKELHEGDEVSFLPMCGGG